MQRQIFDQRLVGDDHPSGMCPCVADCALHAHGRIDQRLHARIGIIDFLELGNLHRVFFDGNGSAGDKRHQLGDAVHVGQGDVHHTAYVTDSSLRTHGTEGDDRCHLVIAIFSGAVFHHLGAAVVAEVQVDVGHADAPGVEEALEDEIVLERVDQRDVQRIRDDRAGG